MFQNILWIQYFEPTIWKSDTIPEYLMSGCEIHFFQNIHQVSRIFSGSVAETSNEAYFPVGWLELWHVCQVYQLVQPVVWQQLPNVKWSVPPPPPPASWVSRLPGLCLYWPATAMCVCVCTAAAAIDGAHHTHSRVTCRALIGPTRHIAMLHMGVWWGPPYT